MKGFIEFIQVCRSKYVETVIVSHKTEHGHFHTKNDNLREAALTWLTANGFFTESFAFSKNEIYFESSQVLKIKRIEILGCTHFIDDLIDIFLHPSFPTKVQCYLLHADSIIATDKPVYPCINWHAVKEKIFTVR